MKLYTEEEIRRTFGFEMHEIEFKSFMNAIKPIELPSDEEIWDKADEELSSVRHYAFMRGTKWMRDKIQGGKQ